MPVSLRRRRTTVLASGVPAEPSHLLQWPVRAACANALAAARQLHRDLLRLGSRHDSLPAGGHVPHHRLQAVRAGDPDRHEPVR